MLLGLLFAVSILQAPPESEQSAQLGMLLERAVENARRYTDALRNLTAEETRETEIYARNGAVQKRRKTRASLVVHQAGTSTLAEFRRVSEVDGKPLRTNGNRLESLLRDLSNAESTARELELIQNESSRYDLEDMRMRGMSLNQAWPLENPAFRRTSVFRTEGTDRIAGRQTVIVRYENSAWIPEDWRAQNLADLVKPSRVFSRGRIWIDAETAEIWRYETETMVEETTLPEPAVWDRMEFFYAASPFGIPTPQKIVWTNNANVSRERGRLRLSLKGKLTAEYGPFKRFGSDVKITPVSPQ
jgi:hypothetical protein